MDERVFESMKPYFMEKFGNASSNTHSYGWDADLAVETARKQVASLIQATPKEIFFTSGATESNNLAIQGVARSYLEQQHKVHIISTLTEHRSSIEILKYLSENGVEVTLLKPDSYGRISAQQVEASIKPHTRLVSVIWANNEIGTLNPLQDIGDVCEAHKALFHVDASQGCAYLPLDVQKNKIGLLSLSAHKMYGPKGVGGLFVRQIPQRVRLAPLLFGAGHEKGIRPGTLNVPAIVGFGKACEIAQQEMKKTSAYLSDMRDQMLIEILKLPHAQLNGHTTQRLPNNLNFTFESVTNAELIKYLKDIALSTGSACSTGIAEPSHVLGAIGLTEEQISCTVRIGLHKFLTPEDAAFATDKIKKAALHLKERSIY